MDLGKEQVSHFEPPPATEYTVLNLGAGVQSSALALMCAKGEITPMPDFAVFADTQAEPTEVYTWLDWLEKQLPFPVYRVTHGNLTEESLKVRVKSGKYGDNITYLRRIIPVFAEMPNGELVAALGRSCTADFKIKPLLKKVRKECKIRHGQKNVTVTQMIGISYDEMQRMKPASHFWTQHRWPLIEKRMTRSHCIEWMRKNNYPTPPRSACYYCPFHSNEEWRRLKTDDPEHFQKAVEFERSIREGWNANRGGMRMDIYLHRSCKTLDKIDFSSDEDKGQQTFDFQSECEGMCGL